MKKRFFFLPLVAALALTGCSSDEPDNGGQAAEGAHYLAVNIVNTPTGGGSKYATGDNPGDQNTGDPNGATYENGLEKENKVTNVRFYFFNENGVAVPVKAGKSVNYYDWENPEATGETGKPNVEKVLQAVLLIETNAGDVLPQKIAAVVNPDVEKLGDRSMNLNALVDAAENFAIPANEETPRFIMFNSVYLGVDRKSVQATSVDASYYEKSADEAKHNPVIIHVERNVAKVRLTSSLTADANNLIQVKDNKGNAIMVGGKPVYVKLNGWNVTATLQYAYTGKHLDATWYGRDLFGNGEPWNNPQYFRSYWAAKCTDNSVNLFTNFDESKKFGFAAGSNYTYCNENGERTGDELIPTEVIVGATLCDADGNPFTVTEYAGIRYADNATFNQLKKVYLAQLRNSEHSHYKKTVVNGEQIYTEISSEDITFKTATEAGVVGTDHIGGYYVYACLTPEAEKADWYTSNEQNNTNNTTAQEINAHLMEQQHAKIWKNGMTYYYFDIKHIGNRYGTIRNHIYDANLTNLYGLGTPVYNPSETIYPQKPVKDDTFIAAQIKILTWRVLTQKVTLDWGD